MAESTSRRAGTFIFLLTHSAMRLFSYPATPRVIYCLPRNLYPFIMKYCRYDLEAGSCYRLVELLDDQETITRAIDLPVERRRRATQHDLESLAPVLLTEAKLLPP